MRDRPAKGMKYLNMGPWPGFVGLCFDEKVFAAEMKRIGIKQSVPFLGSHLADATIHHFVHQGVSTYILTLGSCKGKSKELVAGLVAHEAVHIIQNMKKDLGKLGKEAEAYLVQMIVQETLQILWKSNNVRVHTP